MTRAQFAKDLASAPPLAQKWGRNVLKNLAIIHNPRTGPKDREAARVQLPKNYAQFERFRDAGQ